MKNLRLASVAGAWLLATSVNAYSQPGNAALAPDELPQHLVKILRTSNKAQTNRYIPKVYDFQNVNPYAVVRFYRRAMEIEEGAWFSFVSPDGNSGKLLLVFPEYQEAYIDQLMASLDVPGLTTSSGSERALVRLKHRDANDLDFNDVTLLHGTPTADVVADSHINAVYFEDAPSGLERITTELANFDRPTPQVEVQATVYEIDLTDDGRIGLDYISWKNGPGRNLFAIGAFAEREKISTLTGPNPTVFSSGKGTAGLPGREFHTTGRNGVYLYDVPSAYFDFLVARGCANILTQSKLVALNQTTALLEVGEDILYYQEKHNPDNAGGIRSQSNDPFGNLGSNYPDNRVIVPTLLERSLGEASTGFFLRFTPIVNTHDVTLEIFLSLVNVTGFADDGTPVLASRSVDTILDIPHDRTEMTIGGLTRKRRVDSANKIPWLGDIPILGALFGGESKLDQNTMVVATLKTEVIEFGSTPGTAEDARVTRVAKGEENEKTMTNNPGFIQQ